MSKRRVEVGTTKMMVAFGGVMLVAATTAWAAEQPPRIDESHSKDYWVPSASMNKGKPLVPRDMMRSGASGCVAVAYTIDADGNVADPRVLLSYVAKKDGDEMRIHFEKAVVGRASTWQFMPAATNTQRTPITTYGTITVTAETGLHRDSYRQEIADHCKATDFAAATSSANNPAEQK